MLFKEAHSKFLNYLEVIKNKSPKTVEQYDRHLKKFNSYIEEKYKLGQVSKSQQLYLSQSNLEEEDLTDFNFCKSFKDWITVKSKEINTIFYNKR